MLQIFTEGFMSTTRWEAIFHEAIEKGPPTPRRPVVPRQASPIAEISMQRGVLDDESIAQQSASSASDVELVEPAPPSVPAWSYALDSTSSPADLVPVTMEHRDAIFTLGDRIDQLSAAIPRVFQQLNTRVRPQLRECRSAIQDLHNFQEQVGSVVHLVHLHGSLAQAIEQAIEGNTSSVTALSHLEEQLQTFADDLAECSEQTELSKDTLLSLINRVSAAATKRADTLERRMMSWETGTGEPSRRETPLTPDTSFGHVSAGGATMELTMNNLLSQVRALEARLQSVSDRARSTGVLFHRLAFSSEADFGYWYLANNPSGEGPSAFVDMISIWSFAASESGTTEWLVDLHRAQSVGFKASPDTLYAHSMTTRYPRVFVGKVDTILSSQTIKMLESVDAWRGNGMGDGFKERLLDQLQYAVQSHASYCEDYLPDGPLRQAALRSAQVTQHFFQTLAAYLDDELAMLTSFNLPSKQTLLLLSNQVVHICDDLFEFRNQAKGVEVTNRAATATRYGWVTLQALGCMDGYMRDKFRKHPGINSTYMRFLTRNLADQSAIGLKAKLEAMATKMTKVEATATGAATKVALEKLDGKLELIIRANNLKRTAS